MLDQGTFNSFRASALAIWEVAEGLVSLDLSRSGRFATVEQVWSERKRGAGHAGAAMRALCVLADCRGVELRLAPRWLAYDLDAMEENGMDGADVERCERLNGHRLSNVELEDWYARLGFVRTGAFSGDDPEMARLPEPRILYHSAPAHARESIEARGLLVSGSEAAMLAREAGDPAWEEAGAVFLSSRPEANGQVDVWAVEAAGLDVVPDDTTECPNPGESWWMLSGDVPASRMSLFTAASLRPSAAR